MEYMNEDEFNDLDKFITECEETGAAIGDLQSVSDSIDGMFMIPVRSSTIYVGEIHFDSNTTLKDYDDMISMGLDLSEDEVSDYHVLLEAYEEMQNNSK